MTASSLLLVGALAISMRVGYRVIRLQHARALMSNTPWRPTASYTLTTLTFGALAELSFLATILLDVIDMLGAPLEKNAFTASVVLLESCAYLFFLLNALNMSLMWVEIFLATKRLASVGSNLRLTRRVLLVAAAFFTIAMLALMVTPLVTGNSSYSVGGDSDMYYLALIALTALYGLGLSVCFCVASGRLHAMAKPLKRVDNDGKLTSTSANLARMKQTSRWWSAGYVGVLCGACALWSGAWVRSIPILWLGSLVGIISGVTMVTAIARFLSVSVELGHAALNRARSRAALGCSRKTVRTSRANSSTLLENSSSAFSREAPPELPSDVPAPGATGPVPAGPVGTAADDEAEVRALEDAIVNLLAGSALRSVKEAVRDTVGGLRFSRRSAKEPRELGAPRHVSGRTSGQHYCRTSCDPDSECSSFPAGASQQAEHAARLSEKSPASPLCEVRFSVKACTSRI